MERQARAGRNGTARRGQAELDSQERAGGNGQLGEGRQKWKARRGHGEWDSQEQDRRNGTTGTGLT